jgi:hypothetical protein
MKKLSHFYLIILLAFIACKSNISQNLESKKAKKSTKNYLSFGDTITLENVLTEDEMLTTFNSLQMGDTLAVKFASTINDVCTKKGCWMKVSVAEKETLIRFKNYDFFVPKDAKNKKVIVEGKTFLKITSVKKSCNIMVLMQEKATMKLQTLLNPKRVLLL